MEGRRREVLQEEIPLRHVSLPRHYPVMEKRGKSRPSHEALQPHSRFESQSIQDSTVRVSQRWRKAYSSNNLK